MEIEEAQRICREAIQNGIEMPATWPVFLFWAMIGRDQQMGDTIASIQQKFDEAKKRIREELKQGIDIVNVNRKLIVLEKIDARS